MRGDFDIDLALPAVVGGSLDEDGESAVGVADEQECGLVSGEESALVECDLGVFDGAVLSGGVVAGEEADEAGPFVVVVCDDAEDVGGAAVVAEVVFEGDVDIGVVGGLEAFGDDGAGGGVPAEVLGEALLVEGRVRLRLIAHLIDEAFE